MRAIWSRIFVVGLMALAGSAVTERSEAADNDVILVLDVSNSMWGQIDGVSKIEIAREVIGDLLLDWDATTSLGMVAYGHRREGDCGDIELVMPVGRVDAPNFTDLVNSLVPRGRTPLTEAVRLAAETLSYRDNPATVVLLSDGIETCDADPCALATELERSGVQFTAHVIGFDVADPEDQAQLSCIAENTGGIFVPASNAQELSDALLNVTEQAPLPPDDALIVFEAIDGASGAVIDNGVTWTVVALDDEQAMLDGEIVARPELYLEEGQYVAIAMTEGAEGQIEFSVEAGVAAIQRVTLDANIAPASLSVEDPAIPMSSDFAVTWEGPDAENDYITIVPVGAAEGNYGNYEYTTVGSPLDLTAPDVPGAYEVRYVYGPTQETLASLQVTILEVPASVSAPETVLIGSQFDVAWQGPEGPNDYITIVPVGAAEAEYGDYEYTTGGSPADLTAPEIAGAYEVRYVSGQSSIVLASQAIEVVDVVATLEAPNQAVAGSDVEVHWTGPGNRNDRIIVVEAGADEGRYRDYFYARDGSPATLTMPDVPGAYEIRYMTGEGQRTLAAVDIVVTEALAALEAPAEVVAGSDFEATWTGPGHNNDRIIIVEAGADEGQYRDYFYARDGSPAELTAPDAPGDYEVRYMTGQDQLTLASVPVSVVSVAVALEAPESVGAGTEFEVSWTGPANNNDRIIIVEAGADEGQYRDYFYARDGSPAELRAPDAPGDYEVRYMTGQSRATLAAVPISVVAAGASLQAPETVGAGAEFDVVWEGPDNQGDRIIIVEAGADEGQYRDYFDTRNGSPAELNAPDVPGDYEVRYMTGQSRATLASVPITVTAASASLQAPETIGAGGAFEVVWEGPDNQGDRIIIVEAGADDGQYRDYFDTRNGNPAELNAPDVPGDYEVRYMTGGSRATLVAVPITVTAASASLQAPETIGAGADFEVVWEGPNNQGDRIVIVEADADDGQYRDYFDTRNGVPAELTAPDRPGSYEIRYMTGQARATLVAVPIEVTAATASIEEPGEVFAGAEFDVVFEGPGNSNDRITIAEVGSRQADYLVYGRADNGSPVELRAPDEPGNYELRYLTGQDRRALVVVPLVVVQPTATLSGPATAGPGHWVLIDFEGPGNNGDRIVIVAADDPEGAILSQVGIGSGSPAEIQVPEETGAYEVQYLMGRSDQVIGSMVIKVE